MFLVPLNFLIKSSVCRSTMVEEGLRNGLVAVHCGNMEWRGGLGIEGLTGKASEKQQARPGSSTANAEARERGSSRRRKQEAAEAAG